MGLLASLSVRIETNTWGFPNTSLTLLSLSLVFSLSVSLSSSISPISFPLLFSFSRRPRPRVPLKRCKMMSAACVPRSSSRRTAAPGRSRRSRPVRGVCSLLAAVLLFLTPAGSQDRRGDQVSSRATSHLLSIWEKLKGLCDASGVRNRHAETGALSVLRRGKRRFNEGKTSHQQQCVWQTHRSSPPLRSPRVSPSAECGQPECGASWHFLGP